MLENAKKVAKANYEHDDMAIFMLEKFKKNGNKFTKFDEYYTILTNLLDARKFEVQYIVRSLLTQIIASNAGY